MKSRTIWTIILGALLVCCIAVAYTLTKSQAGASSSGESIATIGGKSVTREEWLKEMEDQYGKSTLEDMIDPFLTLKGLELIYERNRVGSV